MNNLFIPIRAFGFSYYEACVLMPGHSTVGCISRVSPAVPYDCFFCDGKRRARCTALSAKGARNWIKQVVALTPAATPAKVVTQ